MNFCSDLWRPVSLSFNCFRKLWLLKISLLGKTGLGEGCTNLSNLEMEPNYTMKSDVYLNPDILRTKNDKSVANVKSTRIMNA